MKKYILVIALILGGIGIVNSQTIKKLSAKGSHAQFTDDSNVLLLSKSDYSTLEKYDIKSNKQSLINKGRGIAYNCYVSGEDVFVKNRANNMISKIDINTGIKKELLTDKSPKFVAEKKKLGKKAIKVAVDVVLTERIDGFIVLYSDGTSNEFSPRGKNTYVNVELSPNGKKVLYTGVNGSEVLSLENNTILPLGLFEATKWMDNDNIIYMSTKDNGDYITESDVYIFNISKRTNTNLTEDFDDLAMYPSASKDGKLVLFNNNENEVFLIEL